MKAKWGLCTQLASNQLHSSASQCFYYHSISLTGPRHKTVTGHLCGTATGRQFCDGCLDTGEKAMRQFLVQATEGREVIGGGLTSFTDLEGSRIYALCGSGAQFLRPW